MSITNAAQLLSLLTLSSTALPIGAYCYSQGVESAIERGMIHDETSSIAYFEEVLEMLLIRFELPLLKRLMQCFDDTAQFEYWANIYRASRESKELLAESTHKIEVLAGMCGYHSANSFCIAFKRATGLSPKQYRDALAH